jgi:hypothetical protein
MSDPATSVVTSTCYAESRRPSGLSFHDSSVRALELCGDLRFADVRVAVDEQAWHAVAPRRFMKAFKHLQRFGRTGIVDPRACFLSALRLVILKREAHVEIRYFR